MELKGKKVLVFGLARSGLGAANLLSCAGADVTVTDQKSREELAPFAERLLPPVGQCFGGYPPTLRGIDLIVVSPGVPLTIGPLLRGKEQGIPVIGELELAYQVLRPLPLLAVTGTNGKSTTTTLLDLMMKKSGFRTLIGGNIGMALTEEIMDKCRSGQRRASPEIGIPEDIDVVVAEISSFQLESIMDFRPRGAAILNITPDHLDRYHSMEEYRAAKAAVFMNQETDDFLVLNADDPETMQTETELLRKKTVRPVTVYFSRKKEVKGVYWKDGGIYLNLPETANGSLRGLIIRDDEILIKGVHNLENAMASMAMALLAGASAAAAATVLREFPGLEHRLEFVREINGITYINDSKGTNVGAVEKSLESFSGPLVLIAGGRDKAGDFTPLRELVRGKVRTLILIGEAAEKMRKVLSDCTEVFQAATLSDAVNHAHDVARWGDVVLLSPACASFDMFSDFEDRGRKFKEAVWRLKAA